MSWGIKKSFKYIIITLALVFIGLLVVNSNWFLKIVYPQPYKDIIEEASSKYQVDSFLIFSIIKTESKFKPQALSSKGARGLMQIMPRTAQWVAEEINLANFDCNMLDEPQYNIEIGTWYYGYLLKQFKGNNIAALAAYNGGEANVKTWIRNNIWSGTLADLNKIPFKETKNYVSKVLMNYMMYHKLYNYL